MIGIVSRPWIEVPVFVAAVAALLATPASGAEELCTELGSDCICSEPFNGSTVDGGNPWPGLCTIGTCRPDADDSPDATECVDWEVNNGGTLGTISSAGQSLPSGHSLTWVLRGIQPGSTAMHHRFPQVNESPNVTVCSRSYQRFDPSAPQPSSDSSVNAQYKVHSFGGLASDGSAMTFQISIKGGGGIHTRADSTYWDCPPSSDGLGHMNECRNNWCRFEVCLDYSSGGYLTVRHRKTELDPSPNAGRTMTVVKTQCTTPHSSLVVGSNATFNRAPSFYAQHLSGPAIRYASHAIMTKRRPMTSSYWIGAAAEIEGNLGPAALSPPFLID